MNFFLEKLIGKPVLSEMKAEIREQGKKFVAVTPDGKSRIAHMEQLAGGYDVAIEKYDGILGILMGQRVIFTSVMD